MMPYVPDNLRTDQTNASVKITYTLTIPKGLLDPPPPRNPAKWIPPPVPGVKRKWWQK
jgi:hypothetical protein